MSATVSPLSTPVAWDLVAVPYAEVTMPFFRSYATAALNLARLSTSARVLDVAAGPGTLSLIAAKDGHQVTAIDFAHGMVKELRRAADEQSLQIDCRVADGQALPFEDRTFDAAFSMFGLIFFPDRDQGHREMFRTLRDGGTAVVSSWQPMERFALLSDIWRALRELLPTVPFGNGKAPLGEPDEMAAEMRNAGFENVEVHEMSSSANAPTLDSAWDFMYRGSAPFALLRRNLGEDTWQRVEQQLLETLAAKYGTGPQTLTMIANIGVGRKP